MKKLIFLAIFLVPLASFGQLAEDLAGASGSTIGPDGALYVTEGAAGRVSRIDTETGEVTPFVVGLPVSPLQGLIGFGGAVDVEFIGQTAYVLVTGVGFPFCAGPVVPGCGDVDGIYRIDGPDSFAVFANIGEFAFNNPPSGFPWELPQGLQYALEAFRGGFLVTDGHHNRLLRVSPIGQVSEFRAFNQDVVPTGLAIWGNTVLVAQAGPIPHLPENGKVVSLKPGFPDVTEASGQPLIVDVTRGQGSAVFALSQGTFPLDGFPAQSANEDTGAILKVNRDGSFSVVIDELNLPTSIEIAKNTAYVTTLEGKVFVFENLDSPPYRSRR